MMLLAFKCLLSYGENDFKNTLLEEGDRKNIYKISLRCSFTLSVPTKIKEDTKFVSFYLPKMTLPVSLTLTAN